MKTWLRLAVVLSTPVCLINTAAQAPKHCGDVMPAADVTKAGFTGLKLGREATPKPDQLSCGYTMQNGSAFTIEVITGPRAKTAADGYQKATSLSKGKIESIAGLGKRAWYERGSAALWVDSGTDVFSVIMGGQEGSPGVKERLEAVARIVLSHL